MEQEKVNHRQTISKQPYKIYKELYDATIQRSDDYIRQIDSRDGCLVKTDGRSYMIALHALNLLEGYKIARGPNLFVSICCMICGAPCEIACRRDRVDKTFTIWAKITIRTKSLTNLLSRCLQCHVFPVFESTLYVKCNGRVESANMHDEDLGAMESGMLKDENLCIRCG
jgi:hypothetical protein